MSNRTLAGPSDAAVKAPAGVMGLRSANGYFVGFLIYDVQLTLRHGRTLSISELVVADEGLHISALPVLGRGLKELARRLRCQAIQVAMPGGSGTVSRTGQLSTELGPPETTTSLLRATWRIER